MFQISKRNPWTLSRPDGLANHNPVPYTRYRYGTYIQVPIHEASSDPVVRKVICYVSGMGRGREGVSFFLPEKLFRIW